MIIVLKSGISDSDVQDVCQRITEMGSRGYKKVCQTEEQWRAQRESDKRNVSERDRGDR